MTQMEETQRPCVAAPIIENIPLELRQRRQWVVWAYEYRKDKWTKVPYTPNTTSKARSNAPQTWRSFEEAHTCYLENSQFFAGIGYMFAKNDPYVGGDRDHDLSTDGIPPTYAEISPSGEGIKFIARANGHYGRKTVKGELYSSGRFFTITGRVIEGHTIITECQEAIDTFLASLGGAERKGYPSVHTSNGSRAQLASAVPEEDWQEGRRLLREELNRLLARLRASAGKETQLGYILREDYGGFHNKWPGAGIVRSDGSLDSSQIRAVFANGVRGRDFTFPQFVAMFYHFYGAECVAKWGTAEGFRQEAAVLWTRARLPRRGEPQPPQPTTPRGRAGSHDDLLDRTYQVLLSHRAGASAIVNLKDVAQLLGVHPGTAHRAINDLVDEKRISKKRYGSHGGLIIDFIPELIYSDSTSHTNEENESRAPAKNNITPELIYKNGIEHSNGIERNHTPAENATENPSCELIYSPDTDHDMPDADAENTKADEREESAHAYIEINTIPTVFLPAMINSQNRIRERVNLEAAVTEALDNLEQTRVLSTGEVKPWLITKRRVVAYVQEHYSEWGCKPAAIEDWYDRIRKRRKNETFRKLENTKREAIEKQHTAVRRRIERAERKAQEHPMPEVREWYSKQAAQLQGRLGLFGYELSRRDTADSARIDHEGYSQVEIQEFKELAAEVPAPIKKPSDALDLVERLKLLKVKRE